MCLEAAFDESKRIKVNVKTKETALLRRFPEDETVVCSFVLDDQQPHASPEDPKKGIIMTEPTMHKPETKQKSNTEIRSLLQDSHPESDDNGDSSDFHLESNDDGDNSDFEESKLKPKPKMNLKPKATKKEAATKRCKFDNPSLTYNVQDLKATQAKKDLIENIINGILAETIKELANPIENMQHVSSKLEQGFLMAGPNRGELLQAICGKLKLKPDLGLDEFLAIVDSRNEFCKGAPVSR